MSGNTPMFVLQVPDGEVRIFRDVGALSDAAGEMFTDVAVAAVKRNGRFTVALSGGSTPKLLYATLAHPEFAGRIPWERVHLFWGDERCVPPDDTESNYGMVREALLRKLTIPAGNVHRMRGELPAQEGAAQYDAELREFFKIATGGVPRFDLTLLGLGEDGHVASLVPSSLAKGPALNETVRLAVATERLGAQRVSLTFPVINHSAVIAFLVTGEGKRGVVAQVVGHADPNGALPAQRVRPDDGHLLWFLDQPAAEDLPRG